MTSILEEKDAIHEVLANYCFYFDGGEFENWVNLFTDDATFDLGPQGKPQGKDALRAFINAATKTMPLQRGIPALKHCVMNEIIKVNGDEATAKSYVLVPLVRGEGQLVNGLAGRYEDHLVKQGEHWLFQSRKVHIDLIGDMGGVAGIGQRS